MSLTCLSRTLDPKDYAQLEDELKVVDGYGIGGQHEHRRWEYALALQAMGRWRATGHPLGDPIYDVGGAGSTLFHMIGEWTEREVIVVDPQTSVSLEEFVRGGTRLADIVTCISVIEHVKEMDQFIYHLGCLLAPGGLLVLTMDYWNSCGPDTAHFAHLRERIFCPKSYAQLRLKFAPLHLATFGGVDTTYHGAHVYDYTFASLILEKRR